MRSVFVMIILANALLSTSCPWQGQTLTQLPMREEKLHMCMAQNMSQEHDQSVEMRKNCENGHCITSATKDDAFFGKSLEIPLITERGQKKDGPWERIVCHNLPNPLPTPPPFSPPLPPNLLLGGLKN